MWITRARRIVDLSAEHAIPTLYYRREFADAGGLVSYGSNPDETYRMLGIYAGRILKGEKPADWCCAPLGPIVLINFAYWWRPWFQRPSAQLMPPLSVRGR